MQAVSGDKGPWSSRCGVGDGEECYRQRPVVEWAVLEMERSATKRRYRLCLVTKAHGRVGSVSEMERNVTKRRCTRCLATKASGRAV
jgi:hypothetical protein